MRPANTNADGNAGGVIVTEGGMTGGYALLIQNGEPTFIYNWLALKRYTITSPDPLPKGRSMIRMDFAYDGGGLGKGGTATLSVNGWQVAGGRVANTVPYLFSWVTHSMWVRTGARRCRQPTKCRSSSRVTSSW
jgi:hypothetical protein